MLRVKTDGQVIARYGQSRKVEWPWRERALPVCKRYSAPTASESPGERGSHLQCMFRWCSLKLGALYLELHLIEYPESIGPFMLLVLRKYVSLVTRMK